MKILLIDDDEGIAWVVRKTLEPDFAVTHAATGAAGLSNLEDSHSLVLLDLRLPDADGLDLLKRITTTKPELPVIMITAHGGMESAVEAMKLGAYDYLEKPFNVDELRIVARKALEDASLREELKKLRSEVGVKPPLLVGSSPQMMDVYKAIGRVAPRNVTVLISGESGTGKDVVAQAIHHNSPRSSGPFIAINSATLPKDILEAELFGSAKGAFTGADRERAGKIEAAHGGTLFLDEIGEMTPEIQAKLLRVIEENTVTPLGSNRPVPVDVRIIAATNRDLEEAVRGGGFREDLYYRLNVFRIRLPSLRERREDIPLLAEHFLKKAETQLGVGPKTFSTGAMDFLRGQNWPGNVRELENAIKRAALLSSGPLVDISDIKPDSAPCREITLDVFFEQKLNHLLQRMSKTESYDIYETVILEVDRALLTMVLKHTNGNQLAAARILGLNRNTLRKKINSLKIKV